MVLLHYRLFEFAALSILLALHGPFVSGTHFDDTDQPKREGKPPHIESELASSAEECQIGL